MHVCARPPPFTHPPPGVVVPSVWRDVRHRGKPADPLCLPAARQRCLGARRAQLMRPVRRGVPGAAEHRAPHADAPRRCPAHPSRPAERVLGSNPRQASAMVLYQRRLSFPSRCGPYRLVMGCCRSFFSLCASLRPSAVTATLCLVSTLTSFTVAGAVALPWWLPS
jgi:hypothetical protein